MTRSNATQRHGICTLEPRPATGFVILPDTKHEERRKNAEAVIYRSGSAFARRFPCNETSRLAIFEICNVMSDHVPGHVINIHAGLAEPLQEIGKPSRIRAQRVCRTPTNGQVLQEIVDRRCRKALRVKNTTGRARRRLLNSKYVSESTSHRPHGNRENLVRLCPRAKSLPRRLHDFAQTSR
jgi:hypothetical protein